MSPGTAAALVDVVVGIHLAAAAFIALGVVAILVGAWLGWSFVHGLWWRLAHVAALAIVALQKLLGESCFLTVWESRLQALAGQTPRPAPAIDALGNRLIHIDVPLWLLIVCYTALFFFVAWLWFRVPPRSRAYR